VIFILIVAGFFQNHFSKASEMELTDDNPLDLPEVGSYRLRVLTPTILELTLITSKDPSPARVTTWDFVSDRFGLTLPSSSEFAVTANSQPLAITKISFKRRVLSATMKQRDVRIGNYIYLELSTPLSDGQAVEVKNPSGALWNTGIKYITTVDPHRWNPAIHVNQTGYMPAYAKKAMLGYYLGSGGELTVPTQNGFNVIDARSGAVVYHGILTLRLDKGYQYTPTPYQQVYEADFSAFQTPGEYELQVPGMGVSLPFLINEGTTSLYARSFALGLYHQRCGMDNAFPFTRFTHGICHNAPADVPTMDFTFTQTTIASKSRDYADNPRHTAPQLKDINSSLYPFQRQGKIDVSGGHHDAGDYSKYTINSAGLVHFLTFAADSFPGVGALDNLGLPESGDGKSDLLQEAKWEADFLAKMQDSDGGFYFLVYPRDREYENDVTPDHGDPQVVWPKTTAVTAAATAALAEIGSSPLFKQQFPAESAIYLQKAQLGWNFLINAIARYGKDGSYQKITHYGNEFMHDDELAWAAAAMFAATGSATYLTQLKAWFPNPNDVSTRRWTWWRMFEGYGNAIRTYAFAARSGRLQTNQLDADYLAKCESEILATADDIARFSGLSAYGTSFGDPYKNDRSAGWYFSSERGFDLTVGYQLSAKPAYIEALAANLNYEGGCNPVNMTYVTGIGWKRQRDVVHQYAQNDWRVMPPSGLPQGNVQAGFQGDLYFYGGELTALSFPPDNATTAPYPYYDRWADSYNTMTEFVVMDQARSLASLSFWMAQSPVGRQPCKAVPGQFVGLHPEIAVGTTNRVTLAASGVDLTSALTVWEATYLQPDFADVCQLAPKYPGQHWFEAEALLPDGRRVFAMSNFVATTAADAPPNSFQSAPLTVNSDMVALYHMDNSLADATGTQPRLTLAGNAFIDSSNLGWATQHSGGALRFMDLGDNATVKIPLTTLKKSTTTAIRVEGMIYINDFKGYSRDNAHIISLSENSNAYVEFMEDKYRGAFARGGTVFMAPFSTLSARCTTKTWHHMAVEISQYGYSFSMDGTVLATLPATEFSNWGKSAFATLTLGNFDGWIDEVVVRSITGNSGTHPVVSLSAPVNSVTYAVPASIAVSANVSGAGTSTKVEFFANEAKIGEAGAPYTIAWVSPPPGVYSVYAQATDSAGRVATSGNALITVTSLLQASKPQISPSGGICIGPMSVSISSGTAGANIRYTMDGSEPTTSSTLYSGPVTVDQDVIIKARAFKAGLLDSAVSTASFVINAVTPPAEKPVLTPVGKGPTGGFMFKISGTPGKSCLIDASSDGSHWQTLTTVTLTSDSVEFIDFSATGQFRLYKVTSY
jgi:hypothetical protein